MITEPVAPVVWYQSDITAQIRPRTPFDRSAAVYILHRKPAAVEPNQAVPVSMWQARNLKAEATFEHAYASGGAISSMP